MGWSALRSAGGRAVPESSASSEAAIATASSAAAAAAASASAATTLGGSGRSEGGIRAEDVNEDCIERIEGSVISLACTSGKDFGTLSAVPPDGVGGAGEARPA
eukprot:scaffold57781_cov28-Tisochrysis_lutea.AAC.6